ncbi:spore coat U domain-containing protein [Methylocystis sp. ATCC 49242]|uniref:Csu type fimbrial protein n=1 Tax=Methylocystis sp. ATCC 49242 TaxID=622637 RepID=UPI0001F86833|nr:spore coat U domain-containing protein [Methylocystis sp. ATCC 49242]
MRYRAITLRMAAAAFGFFACTAYAATETTTFNVQIVIQSACTLSATTLDFGSSGVLSANVDSTNTITVTCNNGLPWSISLNEGTGSGATLAVRKMTGPASATVDYTIYRDPSRTEVWGDGVSSTFTVSGTGTGTGQAQTGYGRVPSQSTPAAGTYTDTITATVTF